MSNNKMLIDASHREETRVVVLRGNRIEEFDFEAQERRQLRGNIYLAKVTRVEPSLQAAFIDYGGNRHGFLAFSEIHPDYYQIPAADRQALLEKEAEDASNDVDDDDAEAGVAAETAEEKPAKRRRSRRSRKPKADAKEASAAEQPPTQDAPASGEPGNGDTPADNSDGALAEKSGQSDTADDDAVNDGFKGKNKGRTIAAAMAIDSISEDAPDDGGGSDDAPKKTATKRAARKKAVAKPKKKVSKAKSAAETSGDVAASKVAADEDIASKKNEKKKPATRKPRKTSRKKAVSDDARDDEKVELVGESDSGNTPSIEAAVDATDAGAGENGAPIENVGQEDALEEVPQRRKPIRQYKIQEVIRRRQVMLVQVVKEERGNKGAALTTYLSLAGRYSVLMPNTARGGGISRKITNPADRKRLKEIAGALEVPKGMGVILRTAGASRTNAEIKRDFEYLMRLWENVRNLTLASTAPFLVYEEGSLIKRSIRDLYHKDTGEIIVSGDDGFREAREFMQMLEPGQTKNVKLHTGEQPILSKHGVEAQLEKMLAPQVTLKSGGYIVIDQTEALVAIDVNSGRSTREHSIEATALQTNLEAADEIARQLRLRDLAGLIVIDFIDMEENRNNRSVEKRMKECLKNDRARIQVGHISHFGLMEMSRQRIRASVIESTMEICQHCQGTGHVRSRSSFAIQIMRGLGEHLNRNSRHDVTVKTSGNFALYILNNQRNVLLDLEERFGIKIMFESDPSLEGQNYTIENGSLSTGTAKPRAAVNPMDFSEEPVEATIAAAQTTPDKEQVTAEGEEDAGSGKRRRRRRGGRGKNRDQNEGEIDKKPDANADKAIQSSTPNNREEKDQAINSANAEPTAGEAGAPSPVLDQKSKRRSESENSDTNGAADTARKTRRPTGRPGKRVAKSDASVVAGTETKATAIVEQFKKPAEIPETTDTPVKAEPRQSRRNTRRVKAEKLDTETSSEDVNQPDTEKSDKKKGWWGKGSFFG